MQFFLVGAGMGFLLAGLKSYIYGINFFELCCFVLFLRGILLVV